MESSLRTLFFGIAAALLLFVGLVIAVWVSWRRRPALERVVEPDAPGILSVAMFGLEPSGSSEPLVVFEQLLEAVASEGVRFGEPMVKDWGLLSVGGPFVLELRALGEGTWRLSLERSGGRPLTGSDVTLQVLALLQSQLQALPAFTGVTWVKREEAKVPGA